MYTEQAHKTIRRRTFLSLLGRSSAAAVLSIALPRAVAAIGDARWPHYRDAIVIDSLGGLGTGDDDSTTPLSASEIMDVRNSGLTAINVTVGGPHDYATDFDSTSDAIAYWNSQIAAHPDVFVLIRHASAIESAKRAGKLGILFGIQGTAALGENLQHLDTLCNAGVRIFQLTYNRRCLVGDGCLEPGNAGLSKLGVTLVAELNKRDAAIDLAHAGERTTLEAIDASTKPIAITHTGCAALVPNPRNKTDNELRRVAEKGGYVGIYLMPFLRAQGQPMAEDLIRHIDHAVEICGEDHVGIGTDGSISPTAVTPEFKKAFAVQIYQRRKLGISAPGEDPNVYTFLPDLNRADRFEVIAELLAARNYSDGQIGKILGGNFYQFLRQAWKG
jgi:membrane dipeptidase